MIRRLLLLSLIPGVAAGSGLASLPSAGVAGLSVMQSAGSSFLNLHLRHQTASLAEEAISPSLSLERRSDFFVPNTLSGLGRRAVALQSEPEDDIDAERLQLAGEAGVRLGDERISVPVLRQEFAGNDPEAARSFRALGIQWQHSLGTDQALTLAAQYGGYSYDDPHAETTSRMAKFGWSGEVSSGLRPRLSGSLFVGDDVAKEVAYRHLGRRFYGFAVDGSFSPVQDHSPYISLTMQWSDYDAIDPAHAVIRKEEYSRLAFGWDWRVTQDWGLRAEANYSLNSANVDLYDYDRRRLFFGTRFDFR